MGPVSIIKTLQHRSACLFLQKALWPSGIAQLRWPSGIERLSLEL